MVSGTSSWKRSLSRKSMSARAAASRGVPRRMPANSTWRKQPAVTTAVGASVTGGSAYTTSAGGDEA